MPPWILLCMLSDLLLHSALSSSLFTFSVDFTVLVAVLILHFFLLADWTPYPFAAVNLLRTRKESSTWPGLYVMGGGWRLWSQSLENSNWIKVSSVTLVFFHAIQIFFFLFSSTLSSFINFCLLFFLLACTVDLKKCNVIHTLSLFHFTQPVLKSFFFRRRGWIFLAYQVYKLTEREKKKDWWEVYSLLLYSVLTLPPDDREALKVCQLKWSLREAQGGGD